MAAERPASTMSWAWTHSFSGGTKVVYGFPLMTRFIASKTCGKFLRISGSSITEARIGTSAGYSFMSSFVPSVERTLARSLNASSLWVESA